MIETSDSSSKVRAVVLGSMPLRENDRIVRLIVEHRGRADAVAHGARRPSSRFAGKLEPFSFLAIQMSRKAGSDLWNLKEAESESPSRAPSDWLHPMVFQAAGEMMVHAAPYEGNEPEAYPLARAFHEAACASPDPAATLCAFVVAWSRASGFGDLPATGGAADFIRRARADDPAVWKRYRLSAKTRPVVLATCRDHVEYHTEKEWKGMRMLMKCIHEAEKAAQRAAAKQP